MIDDRRLDSAFELVTTLKRIDFYESLSKYASKIIIAILTFVAFLLFVNMTTRIVGFYAINPDFGSIRLSGIGGSNGAYFGVYNIGILIGSLALLLSFLVWNKEWYSRKGEVESKEMEHMKKESIVHFIVNIDWEQTLWKTWRARFSVFAYVLALLSAEATLLYAIFWVLFSNSLGIYIYVLPFIAIAGAAALLSRVIYIMYRDLWFLDEMLSQLRWFSNEFRRSGFQA